MIEAQNLSGAALQRLVSMADAGTGAGIAFQVCLIGQPELRATLQAAEMTALRKRVVALEEGRIIRDEIGGAYHRED